MKDVPILVIYMRNFAYVYNGLDAHEYILYMISD